MTVSSPCTIPDEVVLRGVLHLLTLEEQQQMTTHLPTCFHCRNRQHEWSHIVTAFRRVDQDYPEDDLFQSRIAALHEMISVSPDENTMQSLRHPHLFQVEVENVDTFAVADDLTSLSLQSLLEFFAIERTKFRHHETATPIYGVEIVRRALLESTGESWQALQQAFADDVTLWICAHPAAKQLQADHHLEELVHHVFGCFAQAHRKHPFEPQTLGDTLSFLRRCVSSVLLDRLRAQRDSPL